ncbi:MAG TPA: hypothetical protein ENH82_11510 [bacterium]|nr:hypothetical protein [bacterium]
MERPHPTRGRGFLSADRQEDEGVLKNATPTPIPSSSRESRGCRGKTGLNGSVPREPRLSPPRCKEAMGRIPCRLKRRTGDICFM